MNSKHKIINVLWMALGIILFIISLTGRIDSFWSGMGGGLIGVSAVQLIRQRRYKTDEAYRKKVDIESGDERNRYINQKAWSHAAILFIVAAALIIIALKIAGKAELINGISFSMGLLMLFYLISYFYVKSKN